MKMTLRPTNYNTLVPTLTITIPHREGHKSHHMIQTAITPLPQTQQMGSTGTHGVEGGEPYYTAIDYTKRKSDQQKVERPERDSKIINRGYKNWVFDVSYLSLQLIL